MYNNKILARLMIFSSIAATAILFQNCSGVQFSTTSAEAQGNPGSPGSPTCSTVIKNYQGDLRIIIMVDDSGSTAQTDPQYAVRKQTVQDFIAQYNSKTNFTYSFSEFNNDQASVYDQTSDKFISSASGNFSASQVNPFGSASNILTALTTYVNTMPINGDTPYDVAFNAITSIVQNDAATGLTAPSYAVIFMSDGMPNPSRTVSDVQGYVQNVLNAAKANNGRLATVSTVYFGPESSPNNPQMQSGTPENKLYEMSITGNGQFYDANNPPPGGLIENVLTIPGQVQVCTPGN